MALIDTQNDCGIRFLCEDYVESSVISITSGVENAQFPKENLLDVSTAKYFRSESNDTVIVFDLQQVSTLNTIAIIGNTTKTFGFTVASFKTSPANDFTSATSYNIPISVEQNMGYVYFEDVAHRYVELTLTGSGSYTEVGRVLIGESFTLKYNNLSVGSFGYGYTDKSTLEENQYGTVFVDERPMIKTITGSLEHCTKEEMHEVDSMFIRKGRHEPVFMVMDIAGVSFMEAEYKTSIYGYLTSQPQWRASGGQLYTTTINLKEVV